MEEFKEKLLSRVDFSILITITAALCSVWRIIGTETLDGGILAGAYFFMGLFLCFIKCKEIFGSIESYKKLSENTAVYSYPLKLNKERILKTPNLKKISYKARINKLNLSIRY